MARYRFLDAFHRVVHTFSQFLHRIMASGSEKLCTDVFPTDTSVEQWQTSLTQLGYLPRTTESVLIRDQSLVKKVYLCKSDKAPSRHERIVVDILQPGGSIVHLRIDRHRGEPKYEPPPKQRRTLSGTPMSANIGSSASLGVSIISGQTSRTSLFTVASDTTHSSSPDPHQANDTIRSSLGPFSPQNVAQLLEFKLGCEPTLMDLLFIVFATHECDKSYRILSTQCYWYSICIYESLKGLVGDDGYVEDSNKTKSASRLGRSPSVTDSIGSGSFVPGDTSPAGTPPSSSFNTGSNSFLSPESWSQQRPGTNHKIPITSTPKKKDISNILDKVGTSKANFESMERERLEVAEAHEEERKARLAAESRAAVLEERTRKQAEAIEALRAEVERLRAADT